jgi:hypothetical protein
MIIVRIIGGIGNQMFQYAYAKALEKSGKKVKLDLSKIKYYKLHGGYQLHKYNINLQEANSISTFLSKIGIPKTVKEKSLLFDKNIKEIDKNAYVKGYFQTEKYFKEIRKTLLKEFTITKDNSESTKSYVQQITNSQNSCSLHIRRGDYVSNKKTNNIHGTCSLDYYKKAIATIKKKQKNIQFYIFSDDIVWTKKNLIVKNAIYVDHKCSPHEDMYLMSLCKNNITANSSFSWWGAWLNKNQDKIVISPKQWFVEKENEVACKNWIQL